MGAPSGDTQLCYHDVVHGITREAYTIIEVIAIFLFKAYQGGRIYFRGNLGETRKEGRKDDRHIKVRWTELRSEFGENV